MLATQYLEVKGYADEEGPRMVMTPWFEHQIPFQEAAELGTRKVISEHSTIGLVVLTDGSVTDIERSDYLEAEERVISELKELQKPFIVILNSAQPQSSDTLQLAKELENQYDVRRGTSRLSTDDAARHNGIA